MLGIIRSVCRTSTRGPGGGVLYFGGKKMGMFLVYGKKNSNPVNFGHIRFSLRLLGVSIQHNLLLIHVVVVYQCSSGNVMYTGDIEALLVLVHAVLDC